MLRNCLFSFWEGFGSASPLLEELRCGINMHDDGVFFGGFFFCMCMYGVLIYAMPDCGEEDLEIGDEI
jgi:hypothetical protein